MDVLSKQYSWIQQTRNLLFQYCETVSSDDYIKELEGFGWGSMRNLHSHVAECYESWLGNFALKKGITPVQPESVNNVQEMRQVFDEVNEIVCEFLHHYGEQVDDWITGPVPWQDTQEELTVLWLLTHTTTHEFHHKGQMVSMGRQLGYIPTDTDLIAPSDLNNSL